ncbi:interferon alpha-inducible protein 6 isoform X1 [Myotis myotis]|uniref:interferon alpha-inducible protein 6 isoform X1 n=1 Tax=Myotis myotis TaxID=51298 RepID=UPI00174E19B5|nr:interferon alpha-inducible protein 6 isoform X1 [Myotis myotis]
MISETPFVAGSNVTESNHDFLVHELMLTTEPHQLGDVYLLLIQENCIELTKSALQVQRQSCHHAAEGGIALVVLPAALRLRAGGGRQKERLERQRLRNLGRAALHGDWSRSPGLRAARSGLHGHRYRCPLGGLLADELFRHSERGRRARWRAGGHAAEFGGYWWWQCPHGQRWCRCRLCCPQADRQQGGRGGGGGVSSFQDTHPPPYFFQVKPRALSVTLVSDQVKKRINFAQKTLGLVSHSS